MSEEAGDPLMLDFIIAAVDAYRAGNPDDLALIAENLSEAQAAKQRLRDKGYGWTGLGILATTELVPETSC